MASAFSRSMVTRSCGSLEVKVVFRPVSPEPGARDWADDGVGDAVDVAEGIAAAVLQDELEAADGADARDGGRLSGEGDAAGNARRASAQRRATMSWRCNCGPILARSSMGLSGAKMRPEFGELPPASEKPMTEKVPKTPSFLRTSAATRSANSVV